MHEYAEAIARSPSKSGTESSLFLVWRRDARSAPAAPQQDQLIHELSSLRLLPLLGGRAEQPNQIVLAPKRPLWPC